MIISHVINLEKQFFSNIKNGIKCLIRSNCICSSNRGIQHNFTLFNKYYVNYYSTQTLTNCISTQNNDHTDVDHLAKDSSNNDDDSESLNLNQRQLCRTSHQNFILYAYNHFDFETIIKINNQVLAPYQTIHKRKTETHRKHYLSKFLKCISKHHPKSDHDMICNWLTKCIDLLTSNDIYSMLRVRYILNYDNSFETLRSSYGIDSLEKFSNVQKAKEIRQKVLEEKASTNKTTRRNMLMRYLKINKVKFLRDQNITKAVYEANIEWNDESINNKNMDESKFAFIYNLPYVETSQLTKNLEELLSKFGQVRKLEIITDRVPPLATYSTINLNRKHFSYEPKDKYSPLHAIVEFETNQDRSKLCTDGLRVFGILFLGRIIYPELAEYKHSLITALYPPFKKMSGALQFIANTLVDIYDDSNYEDQAHEFSTCKITPTTKKKRKNGSLVVTAEKHKEQHTEDIDTIRENQVEQSILDEIKRDSLSDSDPQWIVLRFKNFKTAYYARQKLVDMISCEPRSFVSFDTKRSIFYNGKFVDLPLFRFSQDNETDITYSNLTKIQGEDD